MDSLGSELKIKCDYCLGYQVCMYVHQHPYIVIILVCIKCGDRNQLNSLQSEDYRIITCLHLKASRYYHSIFEFIKLNLSLQRFEHSQKFRKITKPIKFPLEIDMTPYLANRLDILGIADRMCNVILL